MACDNQNLLAQPVSQSLQRLSVLETAGPRVRASLMYVLDLQWVLRCQTHIQAATTASCMARNTASAIITPATLTHSPCTQKRTRVKITPIELKRSLSNRHVVITTLVALSKYHGVIMNFHFNIVSQSLYNAQFLYCFNNSFHLDNQTQFNLCRYRKLNMNIKITANNIQNFCRYFEIYKIHKNQTIS